MKNDIDKLLELHFSHQPDFSRLDGMELTLRRKIQASKERKRWVDHVLETFSWSRLQITAFGFSLIIGFSAGVVQPWLAAKTTSNASSFEESLSMFALNSNYLPSTALSTVLALGGERQ